MANTETQLGDDFCDAFVHAQFIGGMLWPTWMMSTERREQRPYHHVDVVQSGARAETRLRNGPQKGDTKSGDNDALKHLMRDMDKSTRARRIAYPPQCALNSYLWRVSVRQWWRWLTAGSKIRSGIWRPGHFLVHLAGWNNYQVRPSI